MRSCSGIRRADPSRPVDEGPVPGRIWYRAFCCPRCECVHSRTDARGHVPAYTRGAVTVRADSVGPRELCTVQCAAGRDTRFRDSTRTPAHPRARRPLGCALRPVRVHSRRGGSSSRFVSSKGQGQRVGARPVGGPSRRRRASRARVRLALPGAPTCECTRTRTRGHVREAPCASQSAAERRLGPHLTHESRTVPLCGLCGPQPILRGVARAQVRALRVGVPSRRIPRSAVRTVRRVRSPGFGHPGTLGFVGAVMHDGGIGAATHPVPGSGVVAPSHVRGGAGQRGRLPVRPVVLPGALNDERALAAHRADEPTLNEKPDR